MVRSFRLTFTIFGFGALAYVMQYAYQKEVIDQKFATPKEWSWPASRTYKGALLEEVQGRRKGLINWAGMGQHFVKVTEILEDPTKDGQDVIPVPLLEVNMSGDGEDEPVFDVSAKSDEWIRGYHTCLMGAAKAGENCEGLLIDTTQNMVCPKDIVVGPSNPTPRPISPGRYKVPREEDCVPALRAAPIYYLKILHTRGFNSRQRLEAALGLADWYDYKGKLHKAEEMYDWGLDIAQGSLPLGVNDVIDIKTGVINSKAEFVSNNVLTATTAFARYQARHNNLSAALPIFLSILRARKQLLRPDRSVRTKDEPEPGSWDDFYATLKYLTFPRPPPPPPTNGEDIPTRTPAAICEEAGIMSHIGEIFLASSMASGTPSSNISSPKRSEWSLFNQKRPDGFSDGLGWTRDAMDLAEKTLGTLTPGESDQDARLKCTQCLSSGMENWSLAVDKMLKEATAVKYQPQKNTSGTLFWQRSEDSDNSQSRWESEAEAVEERWMRVRRKAAAEESRRPPYWVQLITRGVI